MATKKKTTKAKTKPRITGAGAARDKRIEAALSKGKEGGGSNRRKTKK